VDQPGRPAAPRHCLEACGGLARAAGGWRGGWLVVVQQQQQQQQQQLFCLMQMQMQCQCASALVKSCTARHALRAVVLAGDAVSLGLCCPAPSAAAAVRLHSACCMLMSPSRLHASCWRPAPGCLLPLTLRPLPPPHRCSVARCHGWTAAPSATSTRWSSSRSRIRPSGRSRSASEAAGGRRQGAAASAAAVRLGGCMLRSSQRCGSVSIPAWACPDVARLAGLEFVSVCEKLDHAEIPKIRTRQNR
jgi:hypothetical protein